jgi:adenylate kinase family enzyme
MSGADIRVVIISGYRGAGKDSFAELLKDKYGYRRVSFADALRESCSQLFSIPMSTFLDRDLKEKPIDSWPFMSPRDILIAYGTNALREHFSQEIWLRLAAKRVADWIDCNEQRGATVGYNYVIPDVRFPNEEKFEEMLFEELGSRGIGLGRELKCIHLQIERYRMTEEEKQRLRDHGHKSDSLFLDMHPDLVIDNSGGIEALAPIADGLNEMPWRSFGVIQKVDVQKNPVVNISKVI